MVKVEPRPGSAPDRDLAAVVGADVLDDRRARARCRRWRGAGLVDAVEPLEDALLVGRRDADALVGDRDLDDVARPSRTPTPTLVRAE